jgi:hypothetical protein
MKTLSTTKFVKLWVMLGLHKDTSMGVYVDKISPLQYLEHYVDGGSVGTYHYASSSQLYIF